MKINLTDQELYFIISKCDIKDHTSFMANLNRLRDYFYENCYYLPIEDCWVFENGNKFQNSAWLKFRSLSTTQKLFFQMKTSKELLKEVEEEGLHGFLKRENRLLLNINVVLVLANIFVMIIGYLYGK